LKATTGWGVPIMKGRKAIARKGKKNIYVPSLYASRDCWLIDPKVAQPGVVEKELAWRRRGEERIDICTQMNDEKYSLEW
jgi:hypothetical protein